MKVLSEIQTFHGIFVPQMQDSKLEILQQSLQQSSIVCSSFSLRDRELVQPFQVDPLHLM